MKKIVFLPLILMVAFLISCKSKQTSSGPDPLVSHIDSTFKPGDDFFSYANNKWFKQHPIPASEQSNGLWQMIQDTINEQIRTICVSSAGLKNVDKGSDKQKIGDFYFSGMDSINLNKRGTQDIQPDLQAIDAVKDMQGFIKESARLRYLTGSAMFGFYVGQDDRISSKNAVRVYQGGISLFERSYYFDTDKRTTLIRGKFVEHMANMFMLMGYDKAKAKASSAHVMKLETALAKASRKREDTRDPLKNYTKISFKKLVETTPNFDWSAFTQGLGLKAVDSVIVGQPEFVTALNGYLKSFPLQDWKDYLKFHLYSNLAQYMDDKSFNEYFNFYGRMLSGVPEPKPRWKRVVEQTDGSLGELIGQVYVKEYLPEGTKEKLLEIGNAIRDVYAERIKNLDWMSPETKEKALVKLQGIVMKVGYPDKWKDMSSLEISRDSYAKNAMNVSRWQFEYNLAKFGKPVDRTEWDMYPQTYNAYYNPSNNEICVPGCNIIVPGYEHVLADDAILYSVIGGSTFGHEITHGFDDQGCKYDKEGNLNNWWTSSDSTKFFARTKLIVEQFNAYVPVDSLHINGEMTQGENIADLAGISMGFEAFKKTKQFTGNQVIAGIKPDQRFFLGYALAWMINARPEAITNQVKSDVHSPAKFRVIGPLSDIPEFYAAFGIKKGDAMWRPEDKRVKIW
ncbi:MAG: M13 family metallopeptidase [Bacteroidetes bacterium]|nr:M13 family metallopeptidase [Bacteroidota bacterium]